MRKLVLGLTAALAAVSTTPLATTSGNHLPPDSPPLRLTALGTLKTGLFRSEDPRIAEINAWHAAGRRIYVVNPQEGRVDAIDASDPNLLLPAAPVLIEEDCQAALGDDCPVAAGSEPNSVAISGSLMAVAVANAVRTDNGHAVFYRLRRTEPPRFLAAIEVGAVPDMITFTEDGKYALTANEGEPDPTYTIDPKGSVSIIEVDRIGRRHAVRTVDFERYDHPWHRAKLEREGVRIFGPNASPSQDLEPEYIATDRHTAYVTLQENNALAIIDIRRAEVERIVGLGLKNHRHAGNALDASDQDGINIRNWPVHGLFQPDAIDAFEAKGRTYLVAANEGDAREYAGYVEAVRLSNAAYPLDPAVFPDFADLKLNTHLGRLNVSKASGDTNGDGLYDRIEVFGGRSISIRDDHGRLVWDSGEMLERLSASLDGTLTLFNTTNSANSRDNRSDDKGIEPESVVVGEIRGRPYAFVGLERDGGIVVFDLSKPSAPALVAYATNRKLPRNPATGAFLPCNDTNDCGDLGPEGLTFVPARSSPNGHALLLVSNEVSSTTTVWAIQ